VPIGKNENFAEKNVSVNCQNFRNPDGGGQSAKRRRLMADFFIPECRIVSIGR
jgi:hypothetical protein